LVKDEMGKTVNEFTHNGSLNFDRMAVRQPFIDERKGPNEERFNLLDTYDKHLRQNTTIKWQEYVSNDYLTSIQRTKMNLSFASHSPRDKQLIDKNGIDGNDLAGKSFVFYDTTQKDKGMKRLDSHITKFEGSAGKSDHYSIYQKHYQVTPDA